MKQKTWFRKKFTFTFANGAAGADLVQEKTIPALGEMLHVTQIIDDNANGVTGKLMVADPDNATMHDFGAKAHNAQYDFDMNDGTIPRLILTGDAKFSMTISGDPGAGGTVITVIAYIFGIN
jgi:hypothetical protein